MKITTLFVPVVIFLFVTTFSFAQQPGGHGQQQTADKTITGFIIDSVSGNPLEYASVAAFRMRDSVLVSGAITDARGFFSIPELTYGKYFLKITFVGYMTKDYGPVVFSPQMGNVYDVGKVFVSLSSSSLNAVEIIAEKPFIEMDLDKKVVNIEGNVNVMGGTALDVLETVPSVTVDMDGNISYRGSENVTILIDGRPANFAGSRKAVLEQIPANMISSIELITNPSAKYDPEGTSGIINIVTKKRKTQNTSITASANWDIYNRYSGNFSISQGIKKFNVYLNYDYRNDTRLSSGDITRFSYINTAYLQEQVSEETDESQGHSLKFGADYFINALNTIGFSVNGNMRSSAEDGFTNNTEKDVNMMFLNNYRNITFAEDEHSMLNGNMYYSRKFANPKQTLMVDFNYSTGTFESFSEQTSRFYDIDWLQIDSIMGTIENNVSDSKNSTILGKIDYTHPFGENKKLETGTHITIRTMDSDNDYFTGIEGGDANILDTTRSNSFLYDEYVYAAYGNYAQTIGKWSFSGGLRFEYAVATPKIENDTVTYVNDYYSLYPTAAISRKIKEGEEIQLTYSKRVNRPSFHSISPFIDWSNSPNLRGGNPYLKPEYIHSIELGYMKIWKNTSIMPSLFYKRTVDLISRYRVNYLDTFSLATYANIASADAYGAEFIITQTFTKWWKINASGSVFYTHINGENIEADLTSDDFSWSGRMNSTMKIGKKGEFQASVMYRGPSVMLQGSRTGMFFVNGGLKYVLIDNKLTLSVNARDIFNTMKFGVTMEDETFKFIVNRKWQSQSLMFGVTWQFNAKNGMQRKRSEDSNMSDDDMF